MSLHLAAPLLYCQKKKKNKKQDTLKLAIKGVYTRLSHCSLLARNKIYLSIQLEEPPVFRRLPVVGKVHRVGY
jgi:hypothetical protein